MDKAWECRIKGPTTSSNHYKVCSLCSHLALHNRVLPRAHTHATTKMRRGRGEGKKQSKKESMRKKESERQRDGKREREREREREKERNK